MGQNSDPWMQPLVTALSPVIADRPRRACKPKTLMPVPVKSSFLRCFSVWSCSIPATNRTLEVWGKVRNNRSLGHVTVER